MHCKSDLLTPYVLLFSQIFGSYEDMHFSLGKLFV